MQHRTNKREPNLVKKILQIMDLRIVVCYDDVATDHNGFTN